MIAHDHAGDNRRLRVALAALARASARAATVVAVAAFAVTLALAESVAAWTDVRAAYGHDSPLHRSDLHGVAQAGHLDRTISTAKIFPSASNPKDA